MPGAPLSEGQEDGQEGAFCEEESLGTPRVADTEVKFRTTGQERPLLEAQEGHSERWS